MKVRDEEVCEQDPDQEKHYLQTSETKSASRRSMEMEKLIGDNEDYLSDNEPSTSSPKKTKHSFRCILFLAWMAMVISLITVSNSLRTSIIDLVLGENKNQENMSNFLLDNKSALEIPHLDEMETLGLHVSYQQQLKLFTMKDKFISWLQNPNWSTDEERLRKRFYQKVLQPKSPTKPFAFILNDQYAYLHVYKSGGSTVDYQSGDFGHKTRDEIGSRKLVTTVRDPLDHFLSGWAECGVRLNLHNASAVYGGIQSNFSYDERVLHYLDGIKRCREVGRTAPKTADEAKFCGCSCHVHPQISFFLFDDGHGGIQLDPKLDIVGDLMELEKISGLAGFKFTHYPKILRHTNGDKTKVTYFPKRKDLLSDSTLQRICDYIVGDYLVFDYEPPAVCKEQIQKDFIDVMKEEG